MKFTKSWALQMLDLNPDWMAIAVDSDGQCRSSTKAISPDSDYGWIPQENSSNYYLGTFTYDGDWKDTLVVRKCTHLYHLVVLPKDWKYCPKCGELLGSK